MPTKTGDKVRIIVLGSGPDAETARAIAESDADVALAAKFTKTVTHLVIDDTVKPSEARVKKAEDEGVPVLSVAEFRALLVAGAEDEEVAEAEVEADEAPDAGPEVVDEPAAEPVEELEPVAESEKPSEAAPTDTVPSTEPVAEAIDEPEEDAADPEKAVPSQAEAPAIETDEAESGKAAKPGLLAKIKSIFGLTGARK